ncbi:hypothetical protein [Roseivirga misakiensis]|uniref:Uncharacterized protein n=1 Tax=Roseivirga misakiensis TaxID=1563681 RepID=A0A1E5T5Q3_9BACT|nr:hypothetical protein [Roseivirga misakiensis]OEK06711.1 hypothetical protein BFP71_03350 [Roseivirga misakiensis]
MERKKKGAWLIHHAKKIQQAEGVGNFEDVLIGGKAGILLSALSQDNETVVSKDKVHIISKLSNVQTKVELPFYLEKFENLGYIKRSQSGDIAVLGVTNESMLNVAADVFESELGADNYQSASIAMSDLVSETPMKEALLQEKIGDTFKIDKKQVSRLFIEGESIGLIDAESLDPQNKVIFNGNLFRREDIKKTDAVLSSLSTNESKKILEINHLLDKEGCVSLHKAIEICGKILVQKVQSVGMFDINAVSNSSEKVEFLTRPSAFSMFGDPFEDDALDHAKALVSSLTYGMKISSDKRGRITMIGALLQRLIDGHSVGPAPAIGQDYKYLESKGVVKITQTSQTHFSMVLLKKEVGRIAKSVLEKGEAYETAISKFFGSSVTAYTEPEIARTKLRKGPDRRVIDDMIEALRTYD